MTEKRKVTVGELRDQLRSFDDDWEVSFSGLDFYRTKARGEKLVQIEFDQPVWRDPNTGRVHIENLDSEGEGGEITEYVEPRPIQITLKSLKGEELGVMESHVVPAVESFINQVPPLEKTYQVRRVVYRWTGRNLEFATVYLATAPTIK